MNQNNVSKRFASDFDDKDRSSIGRRTKLSLIQNFNQKTLLPSDPNSASASAILFLHQKRHVFA